MFASKNLMILLSISSKRSRRIAEMERNKPEILIDNI